ncbi:MAG: hypothetical protein JETT_0617 [Candidatus Jettenia ecosi]|uniref:Uncharacterized protein n=1 Tax=Candidatus Jettenia ecosi TaxID=2494326 RepID=A0A533QE67_9BACT|nr:MAG: hypothetical protein JETT_0617 [Candidatus Jettenia ecosi]
MIFEEDTVIYLVKTFRKDRRKAGQEKVNNHYCSGKACLATTIPIHIKFAIPDI